MKRFQDLSPSLSPYALRAIELFGFKYPTPVQATSIPLFLQNKDVCVEAMTGSGKTLAFGIPIFEMLRKQERLYGKHDIAAMIISPTRELAVQTCEVLTKIAEQYTSPHYTCLLLVGGTSIAQDAEHFVSKGGNIIIGTPGRILDVHNRLRSTIVIKHFEVLILDEADKLLDMGFKDSINQILSFLPKQRRTGLFSATQTKEVKELARAGLRNPVIVSVNIQGSKANDTSTGSITKQNIPSTLTNWYMIRDYDERPYELVQFILTHVEKKIIIFCATCACVDYYSAVFHEITQQYNQILPKQLHVLGFHGKMVAKKRSSIYAKFKSLPSNAVMFTTDVAARGIDIPDVDWIVQLTAPKDPAFFVHRIGRTARAGKKGQALLFLTKEEQSYIDLLHGRGVPLANADDQSIAGANQVISKQSLSVSHEIKQQNYPSSARLSYDKECYSVLSIMKALSKQDRNLLELSSAAFVAFIRAYTEHLCSYIFQLKELDIGSAARSYAVLRLPKMAETRGVKGRPIVFDTDSVNTADIPFRNKQREEARLKKIDAALKALEEQEREEEDKNYHSDDKVIDDDEDNQSNKSDDESDSDSDDNCNDSDNDNGSDMDSTAVPSPQLSKPSSSKSRPPIDSDAMSVRTSRTFVTSKTNKSGMLKKTWIPSDKYQELLADKKKQQKVDKRYLKLTSDDIVIEKRKRKKKANALQKLQVEWDDLADEEMWYRKYKKGKISKEEYEEKLFKGKKGEESGEESDEESDEEKVGRKKMKMQKKQGVVKKMDYRKKPKRF